MRPPSPPSHFVLMPRRAHVWPQDMSYEGDEGIPLAPMGDSGPAHEQMRQRAGHVVSLTHDRPRRTGTDQSWISYLDAYQGASMLLLCTPPPNQPTHHCHLANVAKLCPFHHQSWSVMGHSTTKQGGGICVGPCFAIPIGHYVRTPTHPSKPVPVLLSNLLPTAYSEAKGDTHVAIGESDPRKVRI